MYKAKIQGSVTDAKGRTYRFDADSFVDAPKGTFDRVKELEWIEPKKKSEKPPDESPLEKSVKIEESIVEDQKQDVPEQEKPAEDQPEKKVKKPRTRRQVKK